MQWPEQRQLRHQSPRGEVSAGPSRLRPSLRPSSGRCGLQPTGTPLTSAWLTDVTHTGARQNALQIARTTSYMYSGKISAVHLRVKDVCCDLFVIAMRPLDGSRTSRCADTGWPTPQSSELRGVGEEAKPETLLRGGAQSSAGGLMLELRPPLNESSAEALERTGGRNEEQPPLHFVSGATGLGTERGGASRRGRRSPARPAVPQPVRSEAR